MISHYGGWVVKAVVTPGSWEGRRPRRRPARCCRVQLCWGLSCCSWCLSRSALGICALSWCGEEPWRAVSVKLCHSIIQKMAPALLSFEYFPYFHALNDIKFTFDKSYSLIKSWCDKYWFNKWNDTSMTNAGTWCFPLCFRRKTIIFLWFLCIA